jgi:hypothetical protein
MVRIEDLLLVLDRSRKRLAIAFGVAVLLHMPFTPAMPVLRLMARVTRSRTPPQASTRVPLPPRQVEVELREAVKSEEIRQEQAKIQSPSHGPSLTVDPPSNVKFTKTTAAKPEPEKQAVKQRDPKKEKVKDVGLEGNLNKKMSGKPGMTLGLWFSTMREQPLGKRIVEIASCDVEWRTFANAGVNLLQDFEGVLVVGPNLLDSAQMTAAVRHALPQQKVHDVMGKIVQKSGENGQWVSPEVAKAKFGRVQRVLIPKQDDLFFIAPNKGWQALQNVKEPLRVPSSEGRTVSLVLQRPNQMLERVGLNLPKRIRELRLEVYANPDQSMDLKVELEDVNAEAAQQDAKSVSRQMHDFFADVWVATSALKAITGTGANSAENSALETAPRLDLTPDDKILSGMIHLTPSQARTSLELIASAICKKSKPASAKK